MELLNRKELVRRLGVSVTTTYQMQKKGMPSMVLRGTKRVKFDWVEIQKWLKETGDE